MYKESSVGKLMNPFTSFVARESDYKDAPGGDWALSKKPETNLALWNTIGVAGTLIPATALVAYIANEAKKRKLMKDIDKASNSAVNANMPVFNPDGSYKNTSSITDRPVRELQAINKGDVPMVKSAADESNNLLESVAIRSLPLLAAPAAIWLAASATNKLLEKKYAKELDDETTRLENLQDEVDLKTLEDMGYVRRNTIPKKASFVDDGIRKVLRTTENAYDIGRKSMINLPLTLALGLLATGTAIGVPYFYKKLDSVRKLKEVEKQVLGTNKTMSSPELLVELPDSYEEAGKTTAQLIPGISPALLPKEVVEDAVVIEKPKKDAFLG